MADEQRSTKKVPILLLDGGLGTTLSEAPYNTTYNDRTPLWSSHLLISSPETLVSAHKDFLQAGADIVLTATYQASLEGFQRTPRPNTIKQECYYTSDEAQQYMHLAITLAHQAISSTHHNPESPKPPPSPRIALSLGAYGAILSPSQEYSGDYPAPMRNPEALANWHKSRLSIFLSNPQTRAKISYIAFETIRPIAEIWAVRKAMFSRFASFTSEPSIIESNDGKPWWISHVVPAVAETVLFEQEIAEVVEAMLGHREGYARPWGVGVNCTAVGRVAAVEAGFRRVVQERFAALVGEVWLVLCPDGTRGEVYDTGLMAWVGKDNDDDNDDGCVQGEVWEDMLMRVVSDARESKVWKGIVVGGCCKTLPKDIKMLRGMIDSL